MISEAGTGSEHAVTIARSIALKGPYIGNKANPILTHRHLGRAYPVVNVGHCDLVETQKGEWWMVALASRIYGGYYRNLGRETFLAPVIWEEGWPVVSVGTGKMEMSYPVPDLAECRWVSPSCCDNFDNEKLDFKWNFIRTPREDFFSLSKKPGYLALKLRKERITEKVNPSFVGRRQQHINFSGSTLMEFLPEKDNEVAGIVLLQNNNFNFSFVLGKNGDKRVIKLIKCAEGIEEILMEQVICGSKLYLKVEAKGQEYSFYYGESSDNYKSLLEKVDGRILSTDVAGGFIGAEMGMYASSNGTQSDNIAYFDWFEYIGL